MTDYPIRNKTDWEESLDYEKSGGKLIHMSPDQYLKRVKKLKMTPRDKKTIEHFKTQISKGVKLDPLAIYPSMKPNGRHRAAAAADLGVKKIPVVIWPKYRAQGGRATPRALAEAWTAPEDTDPRLGQFIEEYPSKMAGAIADTLMYPGQVYRGEKSVTMRDPETGEERTSDEAIKRAMDISGAAMTGTFGFAPARAGEAVFGSGPIRATENPRVSMDFRDVTKRVPELQEGAVKVASGEMTPTQYQELVNRHKPVSEWEFVPAPASYEEISGAVRSNQLDKVGKGSEIPAGHPVGLRLDIPSYQSKGIWVPTIHDKSITGKQPVMAHEPVVLISDAVFALPENKALGIAKGGEKSPFATINGNWVPSSKEEAMAMAQEALKDKNWRQVGMDPERHGYFYDRGTQEPILGADQVLQVGPLVLAKNPRYGSKKDFKYKSGGPVVKQALMLTSKRPQATGDARKPS